MSHLTVERGRDDFGLLFWGKNVDRILKLPVREIKLSEHVETGRRLRRVRFDDVRFDLVDVVQIGPFPPLPESPGHVHGHPQGGFVRLSLLFAGWAAFPGTPHQPCFAGQPVCTFFTLHALRKEFQAARSRSSPCDFQVSSTTGLAGRESSVRQCARNYSTSQPRSP